MTSIKDIIIRIDNVVYGGYGLARLDGKVIFVESAIPGDILKIAINEDHKDYSTAIITDIIEPSDKRIKPECPVADLCGGCSYLNIGYDTELEFKRKIIIDQLKRVARLNEEELPEIETIAAERYGYRSHTRFNTENGIKGFFKKRSNQLIGFPENGCLLLTEKLNDSILKLKTGNKKAEIKAASDYEANIFFSINNSQAEIVESENGLLYNRDINGFFQANLFLRGEMIKQVINLSLVNQASSFMDICSGCGFFALPLAKLSAQGYGFDIDPGSIVYAKKNAGINKIYNINFYKSAESEIKPHLFSPDFIVIDPPRSGLSKKGRHTINAINPQRIIYISCNPSTYSRDIKDFIKNDYTLKKLIFIDMFPCTYHIELISLLEKS